MALHDLLLMFQYSLIFILSLWLQSAAATVLVPIMGTKPGCKDKCGNVSIPYPFGIGEDNCHIGGWFNLTCNYSFDPPKLFYGRLQILDISVLDGEMKVNLSIATDCYGDDGTTWATLAKFTFSNTRNRFTAIGCNTIAYFGGKKTQDYYTGCLSICNTIEDVTTGSCNGIGCCQTSIEKGLTRYDLTVRSFNASLNLNFSPCSYAFVAEEGWFNFSKSYLNLSEFNNGRLRVPAVLEWTVGDETCQQAKRNNSTGSYICGSNTDCVDPDINAPGYRCMCKEGYEGNPYLNSTTGGCQDVDECKEDPCTEKSAYICENTEGSYNCICPSGYRDQRRNDSTLDCIKPDDDQQLHKIIIGTSSGLLFLLVSSSWLYLVFRKKKLIKLKEKYFQQNGGLLLQQILKREEAAVTVKIFTAEELEKATKKYDESRILGQGGYGTVYKGTLPNGIEVAIKKSKIVETTQIEQFINEVVVLSQINHINVVKLFGCCLETEVPLLVYEFITNGTLFQHLHEHENKRVMSLSWDNRLRIAVEVAKALAYLHSRSAASIPIIHRDVKSSNVLLDDNFTAKVSDFGASKLVLTDKAQLITLVQGTLGYMDPEYLQTSQLTEKSDVYSFGVLLAELLTSKMAFSFQRTEEERNLANYFLSWMKICFFEILDASLVIEDSIVQQQLMIQVAELTKRCLGVKGEERPTMKEVAMVLDGLRNSN